MNLRNTYVPNYNVENYKSLFETSKTETELFISKFQTDNLGVFFC